MNLWIDVGEYRFYFMPGSSQRIEVPGVVIIDLFKHHNHSYSYKAFFYDKKVIVSACYCNSKTKLYGAVQNLLKQFL